jgi:hypothetical protein
MCHPESMACFRSANTFAASVQLVESAWSEIKEPGGKPSWSSAGGH